MKRVITSVLIVFVLIICCFISYGYINSTTNKLCEHISNIYTDINKDDFSSAQKQVDKLYKHWSDYSPALSSLCRHNEIDDIERLFQRATQAVINEDKNEALIQFKELNMMLSHLPEMERPSLSNLL